MKIRRLLYSILIMAEVSNSLVKITDPITIIIRVVISMVADFFLNFF